MFAKNVCCILLLYVEVLSPTLLHPPEPVEMSVTEQQELGYMPLRDDFEKVTKSYISLANNLSSRSF